LQGLWSQTEYPDEIISGFGQNQGAFSGGAGRIRFNHMSRHWFGAVAVEDIARDFRGDFGFFRRTDYRSGMAALHRVFRGTAEDWYSQIMVGASAEQIGDHDGNLTDQTLALESMYAGPKQSRLNLIAMAAKERYAGSVYDLNRVLGFATIQPGGAVALNLQVRSGDQIDYVNQRLGSELLLSPGFTVKIGRSLNLQGTNSTQILNVPEGRLFTANIAQATIRYNFNVRTFVRLILQYRTVDRVLDHYEASIASALDTNEQSLFSQFLFSYKINAQTVLFLGYSDNHLGSPSYDLTRKDRTLFFKVGYAITA
jgi:hypothetical protein